MAQMAAYSGLRWGELVALGADQVDPDGRMISVNRKVVEVRGHLYVETPKNRKFRRTIYPRVAPDGYPLASRLASRIAEVRTKQPDGADVSHRDREVLAIIELQPDCSAARVQYRGMAGRCREARGEKRWTWHSLRHAFCTTGLFTWKLDATDVSRMAGHANYRVTLDMYVGTTSGVLDRAHAATE
jgi:integrase